MSTPSQPILILDVLNIFTRAYCAYPTVSAAGYQMGGCIGFLKMMRRFVEEQQPSAVYLAWEGGGSQRRRKLFSEYKQNRKPMKLNRFYEDDIPDTEENRHHQILALLAMLKCTPVCQLYVSDCEADDIIAHLCHGVFRNTEKVIASSDKDFYQLLNSNTKIYNVHKKLFVTEADVLSEFRVTAKNFALAKALCGDPSDNIPGIKGLGFKTVAKLYPLLCSDQEILLQDLIDYAAAHKDESNIHKRVVEQQEDLRRNWKLVFLDGGMLSATQATSVDYVVSTSVPRIDRVGLMKQLIKEGVGNFDMEDFFYTFMCINGVQNV